MRRTEDERSKQIDGSALKPIPEEEVHVLQGIECTRPSVVYLTQLTTAVLV